MNKKYLWTFLGLVAIYITLAFTLPTDPETLNRHGISQGEARLLNLTIVLPLSAIYLAALYGFLRLRAYADNVKNTKEGLPLLHLSTGLAVLAFSLPIGSIHSSLLNYIEFQHTDIVAPATIVRNYISLLFPLVAFLFIVRGADGLVATLKDKKLRPYRILNLLGPIVLATLFTGVVASRLHNETVEPTYYLPAWLILLTLVVPYVYIWSSGFGAARKLYVYQDRVKGFIYKRAINYLAKGITVIIFISIFIQFITIISEQFTRFNLAPLLLIIYFLLILYAIGYGMVAYGAKKLKQIEEV